MITAEELREVYAISDSFKVQEVLYDIESRLKLEAKNGGGSITYEHPYLANESVAREVAGRLGDSGYRVVYGLPHYSARTPSYLKITWRD